MHFKKVLMKIIIASEFKTSQEKKFKSWTYEINLKGNNKINLCVYKKWKQAIRK